MVLWGDQENDAPSAARIGRRWRCGYRRTETNEIAGDDEAKPLANIVPATDADPKGKDFAKAIRKIDAEAPKKDKAPILENEVTTYADFAKRSDKGDDLEGHEAWQHANLKAKGLAQERLSTDASKKNPVIALKRANHKKINADQRIVNAKTQEPIENINANIKLLRDANVAPKAAVDLLEESALQHAHSLGY